MYCSKCGAWIDNNAAFCPSCGNIPAARQPVPVYQPVVHYVQPVQHYAQPVPRAPRKPMGLAVASLVLGLVCMVFGWCFLPVGIICALVGFILGLVSIIKRDDGRGMAVAGVILSAIFIALSVIFIITIGITFFEIFKSGISGFPFPTEGISIQAYNIKVTV